MTEAIEPEPTKADKADKTDKASVWMFVAGAVAGLALGVPATYAFLRTSSAPAALANDTATKASEADVAKLTLMIDESRQALSTSKPEHALTVLLEAQRIDPKNAAIQNNLCVAYIGLKRFDEATAACNSAIVLKNDFQLARNNLAWAQAERVKAQAIALPPP